MGAHWPLLSVLIWLPILGGLLTFMFGDPRAGAAQVFALVVAVATFAASIMLFCRHRPVIAGHAVRRAGPWMPGFDIHYSLGVDGLSIALITLTTLTTALVLVGSWNSIENRAHQYFAAFLVLEGLMIGVFSAWTRCCSTCSSKAC